MIDNLLIELSNNKLFGGAVMLLTNIGGKYLAQELPTNLEKMFSNYFILRYLVLFSIFFMATRDIKTSILLSLLFFIFIKFFINEKSTFCLVSNDDKNQIINNKISKEEYEKAKIVVEKFNNLKR
jgi:hypothetical protein